MSRLEVHSAYITFDDDDDNEISIGGYVVWDNVAALVRKASLAYRECEKWIATWAHRYPDAEDDDLS